MQFTSYQQDLFDHKPERLALTGYRCAMAGYDHGDMSCWDELWSAYVGDGGLSFACDIMGSLQYFVRSLRPGLNLGLNYYPRNCRRVCRQECLVLTLLSSVQHGDEFLQNQVLERLLGDQHADHAQHVARAALQFTDGLTRAQYHLLPVPLSVIQSIEEHMPCPRFCKTEIH